MFRMEPSGRRCSDLMIRIINASEDLCPQAFNQRAVDAVRPRIRAIAKKLLDALTGKASFDVIADYAAPLPIIVIAEVLGVDAGDLAQFKRWSDALSQSFNPARTPEQSAELVAALQDLNDYFARAIDARRVGAAPTLSARLSPPRRRAIGLPSARSLPRKAGVLDLRKRIRWRDGLAAGESGIRTFGPPD